MLAPQSSGQIDVAVDLRGKIGVLMKGIQVCTLIETNQLMVKVNIAMPVGLEGQAMECVSEWVAAGDPPAPFGDHAERNGVQRSDGSGGF